MPGNPTNTHAAIQPLNPRGPGPGPTFQPHSTESQNRHSAPFVPPAPDVFAWPWSDKVMRVFKGVSMISEIVKSKESLAPAGGTTAAITLSVYRDNVYEVEVFLGQADETRRRIRRKKRRHNRRGHTPRQLEMRRAAGLVVGTWRSKRSPTKKGGRTEVRKMNT